MLDEPGHGGGTHMQLLNSPRRPQRGEEAKGQAPVGRCVSGPPVGTGPAAAPHMPSG